MNSGNCLLYYKSNRLYFIHAVYTDYLLLLDGVDGQSVLNSTKLIDEDFEIDNIVHKTFLQTGVNFYINVDSSTNLYKLWRSYLSPARLNTIANLSVEELESVRFKFIDLLIGKEIKFDNIRHEKKVCQYLNEDVITPNLLPYLYLVHYTMIKPTNWLQRLVTN